MGRKKNSKKDEEFIDYNPLDTMVPDNYVEEEKYETPMQIMTPEDFKRLTDLGIGDIDSKDAPDEEVEIEHIGRLIEKDIPEDEYITLDAYGTQDRIDDHHDDLEDTFAIELPTLKSNDNENILEEKISDDEVKDEDNEDTSNDIEDFIEELPDNDEEYDDLFQDIFNDEEEIHNKYEALKEYEKVNNTDDLDEEDDTDIEDTNDSSSDESLTEVDNDNYDENNLEETSILMQELESSEPIDNESDEDESSDETPSSIELEKEIDENNQDEENVEGTVEETPLSTDTLSNDYQDENLEEVFEDDTELVSEEENLSDEDLEPSDDSIDLDIDFDDTIVMDPVELSEENDIEVKEPITLATGTVDEKESKELEDFLFDDIKLEDNSLDDENINDSSLADEKLDESELEEDKLEDDGFLEQEELSTVKEDEIVSTLDDEEFESEEHDEIDNHMEDTYLDIPLIEDGILDDKFDDVIDEDKTLDNEIKDTKSDDKKVVVVMKQPVKQVVVKQPSQVKTIVTPKSEPLSVEKSVNSHLEENSKYVRAISKTEKIIAFVVVVIIVVLALYLIISTFDGEKVGNEESKTVKLTTTTQKVVTKSTSTTTTSKVITVTRDTTTESTTMGLIPNLPSTQTVRKN